MGMLYELDEIERKAVLGPVRTDLKDDGPLTGVREAVWCGSPACGFCKERRLIPEAFAVNDGELQ